MTKIKTNLVNYCISHKYFSYLDNLNLHVIGSGGYKKNIQNIGSLMLLVKIFQKKINIMERYPQYIGYGKIILRTLNQMILLVYVTIGVFG